MNLLWPFCLWHFRIQWKREQNHFRTEQFFPLLPLLKAKTPAEMYMRHVLAFRGPNNGSTPRCLRNQTPLQERRLFQKKSSHLKPCCIIFCQKLTFLCYFLWKTKGTYLICKNTWLSPYILALGRVCYDDKHLFKSFNAVVLNFRIKLQQLILGNNSHQIPRYCNDVVGYITGFRAAALFF